MGTCRFEDWYKEQFYNMVGSDPLLWGFETAGFRIDK